MTDRPAPPRPTCPFCEKPWSDAMMADFELLWNDSGSCGCCGDPSHQQHHEEQEERPLPTEDFCCTACGKPLYMAPVLSGS